jgi:hypothetical protein
MLLILRKSLFYLLFIAYFFLTPYVIIQALGYGINPKEGEIFKTGLVSIDTYPKNAVIYLESKRFSAKTPAIVRDLLPGNYHLRITLKGFDSWEKNIKIDAEKVTRIDPVLLLPHRPEIEEISMHTFQDIAPIDASEFKLFAFERRELQSLWRIDLLFKREIPLKGKFLNHDNTKVLNTYSKKASSLVLFEVMRNQKKEWLVYDAAREKEIADLTDFMPAQSFFVDWDPKNEDRLYIFEQGKLVAIDLRDKPALLPVATNILGFGVKHNGLYLLNQDYSLVETNRRGENPEPVLEDVSLSQKIFSEAPSHFYHIEVVKRDLFQKDLLLFRGDEGTLLSNWLPYSLVDKDVMGYQHATHSDQDKILFWTNQDIGVIEFEDRGETELDKKPIKTVLYQSGMMIRQAFWVYQDSHILFSDQDKLFLLDATGEPPYLVRKVDTIAEGSRFLYHERNHNLYMIDAASHHLVRRKITDS